MSVPRHVEEAAQRLEDAASRIEQARAEPASPEALRAWLEALTTYVEALSDLHRYTNESIHEKLHAIAARLGAERTLLASPPPPG